MATVKPPAGKTRVVLWLDDAIILAIKRLAIESPEKYAKVYMESILTTFAIRDELQDLYQHCAQDERLKAKFIEVNADKLSKL